MGLNKQTVQDLFRQAKVSCTPEELEKTYRSLSHFSDQLDSYKDPFVDGHWLAPIQVKNLREDKEKPGLDRKEALMNCPQTDGLFIIVPKVLDV